MSYATARSRGVNSEINKLYPEDRAVHEWYRFVLSFPPHLVRNYLERFGVGRHQRVLDPFCGTGTVPVECKKLGIPSAGLEANPMAHLASSVKLDWSPDPSGLLEHARTVAAAANAMLERLGSDGGASGAAVPVPAPCRTLTDEAQRLLLAGSISPLPLHR